MLVVGLTGGIGSGKTTVADLFSKLGVPVIDTDQISHALTAPGGQATPAIREQFGSDYLTATGSLDRARMRKRVFSDTVARGQLESIMHPLIRHEVGLQLESLKAAYAVVVIPLLIEKGGYEDVLNRVLVVDCSRELQIKRTMARSGLSRVEVEAILNAQADRNSRLRKADDVIRNDGYPDDLANQIRTLNEKYSSIAHKKP